MIVNRNNTSVPVKFLSISLIVLILDQVTKFLTKSYMTLRQSIPVIGDTVRLTYIENDGMAFGIAIGNKLLFNIFSIAAAIAIFIYMLRLRNDHFMPKFALSIIFGGAIGNLIDRLLYGSVVDFLDVKIPGIPEIDLYFFTLPAMNRWPIFNIADVAVSIGMVLLIVTIFTTDEYFESKDKSASETPQPAEDQPTA